jgi:hypothetical protein
MDLYDPETIKEAAAVFLERGEYPLDAMRQLAKSLFFHNVQATILANETTVRVEIAGSLYYMFENIVRWPRLPHGSAKDSEEFRRRVETLDTQLPKLEAREDLHDLERQVVDEARYIVDELLAFEAQWRLAKYEPT